MPTGPGLYLEREKNGKTFHLKSLHDRLCFEYESYGAIVLKIYLSEKKSSIECVEWLEYLNSTNPHGGSIQHALNKGEKVICGYRVDGYFEIPNGEDTPYRIGFEYFGIFPNY